jgi:GT2 family glycosyltransferase
MIRQSFPEVELIANSENLGFSKAVNQGVVRAGGEYILILNPDSVLPEDGLSEVLIYAGKQEKLGAIGCRFIDGTGTVLPECKRNFPCFRSAVFKLLGLNRGYYAHHLGDRDVGEVEVLAGAFMLMRRELFKEMNGFDERFFMFGEDIDLSYRIHQAGYRNRYYGKMSMIHFKGESTPKDATYLKNFYGALEIFYLKHYRHNPPGKWILKRFAESIAWFRKRTIAARRPSSEPLEGFAYCGDRKRIFEALKAALPGSSARVEQNVSKINIETGELILFDSENLSYSEILRSFDRLPHQVKKRIISCSGDFFVGSDDPSLPGECHLIDKRMGKPDSDIYGNQ